MVAERLGQSLRGLPLFPVQVGGNDKLEDHVLIATASAVKRRQPSSAQHPHVAVLRARRHLDGDLALQRGDEHLAADDGGRHGDLGSRDQLRALPSEALVRLDPHLDVQVALARSAGAGVAGAGDPHPLAVLDPGGDVHLPGARLGHAPCAPAALAGGLWDAAVAAAAIARHGADDLAEDAAAHLADLAGAFAARAGLDRECRAPRRSRGSDRRRSPPRRRPRDLAPRVRPPARSRPQPLTSAPAPDRATEAPKGSPPPKMASKMSWKLPKPGSRREAA